MPFTKICIRALSNSTKRSLLRPQRVAKTNQGAFSSHMNSATAKFRSADDRNQSHDDTKNASEPSSEPTSNVFVIGGRLKRENLQPTNKENLQANRMDGRIVRTNDETNASGGSVAAQMSATARHRLSRMKNQDGVIVSNPSQLSIPVSETVNDQALAQVQQHSESQNEGAYHQQAEIIEEAADKEVHGVNKPSGGFFGKVMVFLAGSSVGVLVSGVYAVENSLY